MGEGERGRGKEPKLNTFVSALTYHKSYENRGLIVFTLQVHPPPTQHHHPAITLPCSAATGAPPPALPPPPPSYSCLQMAPVLVSQSAGFVGPPRPASSQILLPDIQFTPTAKHPRWSLSGGSPDLPNLIGSWLAAFVSCTKSNALKSPQT